MSDRHFDSRRDRDALDRHLEGEKLERGGFEDAEQYIAKMEADRDAKLRAMSAERMEASVGRQERVFRDALELYISRSGERSEVWRRSGVRGQAFHLMAKAERAWQQVMNGQVPNRDHFIDMINYAAFAVRLIDDVTDHEGEIREMPDVLDGDWPGAA